MSDRKMLSEAEIVLACQVGGNPSDFDEPYEEIDEGSELTLWTQEVDTISGSKRAFKVRVIALRAGEIAMENLKRVEGVPPSKLFEADILRTSDQRIEEMNEELGRKNQIFGVLFPDGFASFIDTDPASDYADRLIAAGVALAEGEVKPTKLS